ncbi:AraC family transcriptional regulator [Leifsonia sp. ZF2019]|uniref:helix-turn-helix transcriptional regulator n=1 Tax=Leifsonia sp. ZF2019 TaxID=2781978 RepID=UPI001CC0E194|nr:helix-turn-helix transcriptional regulator [Leifsonia sp. ZF2019]UAJ79300.1 AraC family transcriptional regulator [Leifsonia sp. ZF2019]
MELVRNEFATTDIDEVQQVFATAFADGLVTEARHGEPFAFAQTVATDGVVTVSTLRFQGHVQAAMDGSRDVLFTDITSGSYAWRSRGRQGDQDRSLILPAHHELAVEFDSVRSVTLSIDAPTVARWLSRYGGLPPSPALLHQAAAGSDAVRAALRFYIDVAPTEAFESELVRAGLLDVLMSMTAHHLLPEVTTAQRRQAPAALQRAEEYLRDHAADPVSIADAAEAARLSVRGLQEQFQRWLSISPARYLRNVRLEGARNELFAARADGRSPLVRDVAAKWGFTHVGRFAGYYADAYGESPSATLGR